MIFVDTGAWFASVVPADVNHQVAAAWLDANTEVLLTTDYVVDETLTLLKMRGYSDAAIHLGDILFAGELAQITPITPADFERAWDTFRGYRDKDWSFTDCTSRAVMQRLGISVAFAFDQHFRQFGSVIVVP